MEIPKLSKADVVLLPLAVYGLAGGLWKYLIKQPVHSAIEGWIDGHAFTQEEFDAFLGSQALFEDVSALKPSDI